MVCAAPSVAIADPQPPTNTDTVAWTNACSGDLDVATCERLTYIAEHTGNTNDAFDNLHGDLWVLIGCTCAAALVPSIIRTLSGRTP